MYHRDLQRLINGYNRALFTLHGLTPPAAQAKDFTHLLAAFNFEDLLWQHVLEATDQGQGARVKGLFKRLGSADKVLQQRATSLGLHACARL